MSKDNQIRTRIVIGISDNDISQKLQLQPDISLEKAIQIACQSEQIKQQNMNLYKDCAVDSVRQGRWQVHAKKSGNDGQRQREQEQGERITFCCCSRCNRQHGKKHPYPARNKGGAESAIRWNILPTPTIIVQPDLENEWLVNVNGSTVPF